MTDPLESPQEDFGANWREWDPERKQHLLDTLQEEVDRRRTMWRCDHVWCNGEPHGEFVVRHARWNQLAPPDLPRWVRSSDSAQPVQVNLPWFEWLFMGGRGTGKTRAGAQFVKERNELIGRGHRIALIGRTAADVRDTMVEGESGLLNVYPSKDRPEYQPSKRRVLFKNGGVAHCYSSDEPDQLRGPQHHTGWADEVATFGNLDDVLTNYRLGMRLGADPRVCLTTTPRPRSEIRKLRKSPTTVQTTGTTYDNLVNLAPVFADLVLSKYQGTRLGRQELFGEFLDEIEGALWTLDLIDQCRVHRVDQSTLLQTERVVAIDPAVTVGGDETGIVVAAALGREAGYVLQDASGHYSPHDWASHAIALAHSWGAGYIVAETNNGGEMVRQTLESVGMPRGVRYRALTASRGKALRAEPVSALYERGLIFHVGVLPELEDQMTTWTPEDKWSPDRLDALVWAINHLFMRKRGMADVA